MDHRGLGHVGKQSPRAVLLSDKSREKASRPRRGRVGTAVECYRPRATEGLKMRWHHRLVVAVGEWFQPSARDRDLDEELQFHFDRQVQENLDAGMPADQARRAAALAIGNAEPIREAS